MSPPTRRRALQGAVGLLGALAGCSGIGVGPEPSPDEPPSQTPAADGPSDGRVHAPDHVALRSTSGRRLRPIVSFARDAEAVSTDEETVPEDERTHEGLVASAAVAATVTVDESALAGPELSASPAEVRAFLEETDFENQTVYVDSWPVEECYRLELCHAAWDDGEVETQYGRVLRPHDARCEGDVRVSHVTLVRFPAALDPERHRSRSGGVHSGECSGRRDAPGSGDSDAMVATTSGGANDAPTLTATDGGDR